MDINLISPYIRRAMRSLLPAGMKIRRRVILDYEIIYLESGEWRLWYDGVEYICREGDFILIRPGVLHSIEVLSRPVSQPHIHFDMCYSQHLSEKRFISFQSELSSEEQLLVHKDMITGTHPPVISSADRGLSEGLYRVIDTFEKRDIASRLECRAEMTKLIGRLLSLLGETAAPKKAEPLSQIIKQFIDNNLSTKITLSLLEMHFRYNKFYIEKRFREDIGEPISKYYNRLRLGAIKSFLEQGHSVTETAEHFEFESIYSFSRYFKKAVGLPPSEYAKKKRL